MSLWKQRDDYTKSKDWPIVPFRLTKYEETDEQYKPDYKIGLDENLVKGWAVSLSENLGPNPHPVMVWEKESIVWQRVLKSPGDIGGCEKYKPIETELFYKMLAPICQSLRDKENNFHPRCRKQDENAVDKIFQIMDQLATKVIQCPEDTYSIVNSGGHIENLSIQTKSHGDTFYFKYICPCLGLTEIIFPVRCEGITIALIVTGQIVENVNDVIDKINKLLCFNKDEKIELCKKVCEEDIEKTISTIYSHISSLQELYAQHINGVRQKFLNETLNKLTQIFLSDPVPNETTISKLIDQTKETIEKAKETLKKKMGIEEIALFLDIETSKLDSRINKESDSYSTIMEEIRGKKDRCEFYKHYEDILGLFRDSNMIVDREKSQWGFFIWVSHKDDDPIMLGIKYADKGRFLREEQDKKLLFEEYLLSKFVFFVHNAQLKILAQRRALILIENRDRLSHEIGQVAIGLRSLDYLYNRKIEEYEKLFNWGKATKKIDTIIKAHDEFLPKVRHYRGDVGGLFEVFEMLVKVFSTDYIPNPEIFDLWKVIMNRWNLIFKAECYVDNKYLQLPFGEDGDSELRKIITDPYILQTVLYNVVNNAIKYSLVNTIITVDIKKEKEPEMYIFTVKNFGSYLDPNDKSIYESGVRYPEMKGVVSTKKDYVIPGEGLGLYWCKKLLDKLGGQITHNCSEKDKPVCKYNIPLMKPFFERYEYYAIFKEFWDKKKELGLIRSDIPEPSYEEIRKEYEKLNKKTSEGTSEYDRVVTPWEEEELENISFTQMSTDIAIPTYEVTFTIKIPRGGARQ